VKQAQQIAPARTIFTAAVIILTTAVIFLTAAVIVLLSGGLRRSRG
jgi:hypothetical protein